jgi:ABC-type multidrug transport system fused ATPase/permease subunit
MILTDPLYPSCRYIGIGVAAMFVSSATNMAFPALIGRVLDRTTQAGAAMNDGGGGDKVGDSSLKAFVIRALAIFLAGAIGSCVRTHCLRMAKEKTATRLRKKLFRTLLHQVGVHILCRKPHDTTSRL